MSARKDEETRLSWRVHRAPRILGIGGTMRPGSSTERLLRVALNFAAEDGAQTVILGGADLDLPNYAGPGERVGRAERLISELRRCDGLIIATPSYHGAISGLIKNALDYTEDMRADTRVYLDGLPVGCICSAGGWQAAGQTLAMLRSIAHALRAWPTPLGVMVNSSLPLSDTAGDIDSAAATQLELLARQVTTFAKLAIANTADNRVPDKLWALQAAT